MLTKLTFDQNITSDDSKKDNRVRIKSHSPKHKSGADFIQLINSWEKIVGKGYSDITIPLRISYKVLYIVTTHSSYSQQLSFNAQQILEKIIELHPAFQGNIKDIRFQVSPNFFLQKTKAREKFIKRKEKVKLPHKYSPEYRYLQEQATHIYADIEDVDLKEQLISLYIQSVFSKK
jgi:hypothetical protein